MSSTLLLESLGFSQVLFWTKELPRVWARYRPLTPTWRSSLRNGS